MGQKIETNVVKPGNKFMVNDIEYLIITPEYEYPLDSKIEAIEYFMETNNGKNKTEEEKDDLYKRSQQIWQDLSLCLRDTKYNFWLNRPQYRFITDLILTKMEYDVNTVFFAIELTSMLSSMKDRRFIDDSELISFPVNATEITYIYHLISKHKVKGLSKESYTFAHILKLIGDISKVFNYYDTTLKSLANEIQDWITLLGENVTIEPPIDAKSEEVVETFVVKPKKSKAEKI